MKWHGRTRLKNARGLSLVELLVALTISGLVASAAFSVFQSSGSAARVSENVTAVQMNLRAAMDLMSRDIRQAGFGLDETPTTLNFGGGNTFSAPIAFTNSASGPDSITLVGVGHLAGYLKRADDSLHTGDNACNENNDDVLCLDSIGEFLNSASPPAFVPTRRYVSVAGMFPMELHSDASTHDLTKKRLKLAVASNKVNANYRNADKIPVYIIQAVQYSIATDLDGCSVASPCLVARDFSGVRGGGDREVVAQHIDDLQLAYGVDAVNPRDRLIDYPATGYTESAFQSNPLGDPMSIVAVRLNLLGRTPVEGVQEAGTSVRTALEDRPASATPDHYRRRILTKVIKIRNPRS